MLDMKLFRCCWFRRCWVGEQLGLGYPCHLRGWFAHDTPVSAELTPAHPYHPASFHNLT